MSTCTGCSDRMASIASARSLVNRFEPGSLLPFPSPLVGEGGTDAQSAFVTGEGFVSAERYPSSDPRYPRITFSHKGRRKEDQADLASAPSIIATAFVTPYTATQEPKRGPFSWPSSTW